MPVTRRSIAAKQSDAFARVKALGLALPGVEAATKYDGSPVLKLRGCFMAGLASHVSAEPDTLVVRMDEDDRDWLIEDAPEAYYITDYYRRYPLVLIRLSLVDRDALADVLAVSWRLTALKAPDRRSSRRPSTRSSPAHKTDRLP